MRAKPKASSRHRKGKLPADSGRADATQLIGLPPVLGPVSTPVLFTVPNLGSVGSLTSVHKSIGLEDRPHGHDGDERQLVANPVLPGRAGARLTVNGQFAKGRPFPRERDGRTHSTCALAFSESWLLPYEQDNLE